MYTKDYKMLGFTVSTNVPSPPWQLPLHSDSPGVADTKVRALACLGCGHSVGVNQIHQLQAQEASLCGGKGKHLPAVGKVLLVSSHLNGAKV